MHEGGYIALPDRDWRLQNKVPPQIDLEEVGPNGDRVRKMHDVQLSGVRPSFDFTTSSFGASPLLPTALHSRRCSRDMMPINEC